MKSGKMPVDKSRKFRFVCAPLPVARVPSTLERAQQHRNVDDVDLELEELQRLGGAADPDIVSEAIFNVIDLTANDEYLQVPVPVDDHSPSTSSQ